MDEVLRAIDYAQQNLSNCLRQLEYAIKKLKEYDDLTDEQYDTLYKLQREYDSLLNSDDRLGDIRTGRN
jgi:hypothetical protein